MQLLSCYLILVALAARFVNVSSLSCYDVERPAATNDTHDDPRPATKVCDQNFPEVFYVQGGSPTEPREFPYMCALCWESDVTNNYNNNYSNNTFDCKCGGALIETHFIITAAHCAYVNGKPPAVILPGGLNLTDSAAKFYKIKNIIMHPDYDPNSVYNDIALIQTFEPIFEERACLWPKFELEDYNVTIIGYGDTKFDPFRLDPGVAGPSSPHLLKAELLAVSNEECSEYYDSDFKIQDGISKTHLCAKDPEELRDSCQGDSGGPLIMQQCWNYRSRPFVVGITSFGQGCGGEPPAVYTRISEYIDWIEDIVWPPKTKT